MKRSHACGSKLFRRLSDAVARNANRPAFVYNGEIQSYAELWASSGRAAKSLIELNVSLGDTVGSWSPNAPETIVIQCAALRVGAIATHLNPDWDVDQAAEALKATRTRCLFIRAFHEGRQYPAMTKSIRPQLQDLHEVVTHGRQPRFERVLPGGWQAFLERGDRVPDGALAEREDQVSSKPDDRIALRALSGAKGQNSVLALSEADIVRCSDIPAAGEKPLTCVSASLYHPAALMLGCFSTLLLGGTVILHGSDEDAPSILGMLRKTGVATLVTSSKTAAEFGTYIVEHPEARADVDRCWIVDQQRHTQLPPVVTDAFGAAAQVVDESWPATKMPITPDLAGTESTHLQRRA